MRHFLAYFLISVLASCSQPGTKETAKERPSFSTKITDPEVELIVEEYLALSTQYNKKFNHTVSIGFSDIKRGDVIGTCTYGSNFREVDLDTLFWDNATWLSKVALIYHELTHCYCGRDHDFGSGTMYPDRSLKAIIQAFLNKQPLTPLKPAGYFGDSCPLSNMHPVMIGDSCFYKHYSYYVKEMFNRCKEW